MKDLIHNVYFDKIRYLLSHVSKLDLSSDELLIVLTIILIKEEGSIVSLDSLAKSLNFDNKKVDDLLTLLTAKRYLEIKIVDSHVDFNVDSIFDLKQNHDLNTQDLFKIFEEEFSRTFSQKELVRLNEWMQIYSRDELIDALRSASIMNKLDLNYINKILENNRNES